VAEERDDLEATVGATRNGRGDGDLRRLQGRVRLVVAVAFTLGLAIDRVGPLLSDDWVQLSDWGLGLMLAAILVLLGVEGFSAVFRRFLA
jgi:hypothetical protein